MTAPSVCAGLPAPRPRAVSAALVLLWLGLALQFAGMPGEWHAAVAQMPQLALLPSAFLLAAAALAILVYGGTVAWLNWKIMQRRNWARITCLVSAAVELAFGLAQLASMSGWPTLAGWQAGIGYGMSLAVVVLLTRPTSRTWFRSR